MMKFLCCTKSFWILSTVLVVLNAKEKPKGVAKILDFKECDTTAENPLKIKKLYLDSVSNGYKKVSAEIEFTRDINENLYYTITVEQYKNGKWDFVIDREGKACDLLEEYAADAWKVIRERADPPVPEACSAKAGTYKIKDLEITKEEFKPDALYGTVRVNLKLFENENVAENFACATVSLEICQRWFCKTRGSGLNWTTGWLPKLDRFNSIGFTNHVPMLLQAFSVKIVNITNCEDSDEESGTMEIALRNGEPMDQRMTAVVFMPEIDKRAHVKYESHAWDPIGEDYVFLFSGRRSICNHLVNSVGYKKLREFVPKLPADCPIRKGDYSFEKFPVSGQYAALSDLRNIYPLVKHKIRMVSDDELVLCRIVYTLTE